MDISIIVAYIVACAALVFMPGPDILFVITESLAKGTRTGITLACGLCSGVIVHTCLCVSGVAIAIAASPAAFSAVRLAGAAYLLWLARGAWLEKISSETIDADFKSGGSVLAGRRIFARGFIMNVSNPKVIIFFLSFIPQFITPGGLPVWIQTAVLGALFMLTALPLLSLVAVLAAKFAELLKSRKFWVFMKYARVFVFAAVGLSMIVETVIEAVG